MRQKSILSVRCLSLLALFFTAHASLGQPLADLVGKHGVSGSVTVYDLAQDRWYFSDEADADIAMQAASTFKVANLLIGLETGAIADENEVIPWPGHTDTTRYGYRPDIYKDISVAEAFRVSAGWAFVELADRIPRATYRKYLADSDYGNLDLSESDADFWNFGPMKISPRNQVCFLVKLHRDQTPFSTRSTDILKRVMITEEQGANVVRSKTGWTRTEGKHIGWWVGYVTTAGGEAYFFCTRITKPLSEPTGDFSALRKQLTRDALKQLFGLAI